jgi:hypothetical protein
LFNKPAQEDSSESKVGLLILDDECQRGKHLVALMNWDNLFQKDGYVHMRFPTVFYLHRSF